jgi:hypothetical protein
MKNANDINQLNKDSIYSKALPAKIDYEKLSLSPYFAFRPHDAFLKINNTTSQISNPLSHETSSQNSVSNEVIATDA